MMAANTAPIKERTTCTKVNGYALTSMKDRGEANDLSFFRSRRPEVNTNSNATMIVPCPHEVLWPLRTKNHAYINSGRGDVVIKTSCGPVVLFSFAFLAIMQSLLHSSSLYLLIYTLSHYALVW